MKLISLNTWGATQGGVLLDFIKNRAPETDIFCFQEVFSAGISAPEMSAGARMRMFEELSLLLPDFIPLFGPKSFGYDYDNTKVSWPLNFGLATFVKKSVVVTRHMVHALFDTSLVPASHLVEGSIIVQITGLSFGGKNFSVANFHGMSQPGKKTDTEERLLQSRRLLEVVGELPGPVVLCGDFNLLPETESIAILESRFRNLISEFGITNTRNEISWNKHPAPRQCFADFTFVSQELKAQSFQVPYLLVSDHLPMILEFEI